MSVSTYVSKDLQRNIVNREDVVTVREMVTQINVKTACTKSSTVTFPCTVFSFKS